MDLYVFGAGASKAVHPNGLSYPLGADLRNSVLDLFEDYLDESRPHRTAPRSKFFADFIDKFDVQRPGGVGKSAVERIYHAYTDSTVDSVDEHVAFIRKSEKVDADLAEAIFQVAVGLVLAFCENPSPRGEDWMRNFLRRYEHTPEGFRVITFNYDRSFQCRYQRWLESTPRTSRSSFDVVASVVQAIYGSLYSPMISIPYGEMKNNIMHIADARQEIGFARSDVGQTVTPKFDDLDFKRLEIHGLFPRLENFRWIPHGKPTAWRRGEVIQRKKISIICNVFDGTGDSSTREIRIAEFKRVLLQAKIDLNQVDFVDRSLDSHFLL